MFIVYHKETTLRLDKYVRRMTREKFETIAAAKAGLTRACKKDITLIKESFAIVGDCEFYAFIEKKEVVQNLMSGKDVVQGVNTSLCLDVSSETYWSA